MTATCWVKKTTDHSVAYNES